MADDVSPHESRLRSPDTSSRCRASTVTATHDFEVANFSQLNGHIGAGRSVTSAPFTVGGYTWAIDLYPDGSEQRQQDCCCTCFGLLTAASAFVTLRGDAAGARARFTLSLVDRTGRASRHWRRRGAARTFGWPHPASWGFHYFYLKPFLRLSRCVLDGGRLTIRCELTVLTPVVASEDTTPPPVPAPELPGHLRGALRDGTGADVTFHVGPGREVFRAHRVILAARSPVFRAELYGHMAERDPRHVTDVVDVEPAVFEMLLEFVYTDSLPGGGRDEGCSAATMQHLLVAADRYGMDRLKLVCEEKLCKGIVVSTVTATLALADQHHCQLLKEACIAFVSSSKNLRLVVATDEFKQLMATSPLLLKPSLDSASSATR